MKKFIAGVVVGAIIASALPAYGAVTTLVGKKVAGESIVELNGETVGTAIIASRGHAGAPVGLCFSGVELQLEAAVGRGTRGNRDSNHHCSREQKSSE